VAAYGLRLAIVALAYYLTAQLGLRLAIPLARSAVTGGTKQPG
jgi:hypothetical protein